MKAYFNKAKDVVVSGYNKVRDFVSPALSFAGKATQAVVAVGVGVVTYTSDVFAAITLDTAPILADVATIGAAVVGIVIATLAFKVARSMLGATR